MKKLLAILALSIAATSMAYAKDEKAPTPQQERMKNCNADAKTKALKGDERKHFMSNCLSGKEATAEPQKELTPQQAKMQNCNKEAGAKGVKGPDRKKFMSECLKGDAKPSDAKPAEAKKDDKAAKPADKK